MGVIMPKITISGHPGSGTSSLVGKLMEHYNWSSVNGGQIFRDEAKNRKLSLAEFGKLCNDDETIDRELDEKLKQYINDGEIEIVESRLSGWWAYKLNSQCVRLWLNVSDEERANRVVSREGISFEQALQENSERAKIDSQRYMSMYGLNPEDKQPYTHVVDATHIGLDEVFSLTLEILEG
jgi:predicted cytidylate kinase